MARLVEEEHQAWAEFVAAVARHVTELTNETENLKRRASRKWRVRKERVRQAEKQVTFHG
jgi:hypothetical protein